MQPSEQAVTRGRTSSGLRGRILAVCAIVGVLFVGFGSWSLNADLSSAVLAPGRLVVEGNIKRIQSPISGPIAEIAVREGQRVAAGDLLVRLDDTQTRAALNIVAGQLIEAQAQRHRLVAERDDEPTISWPHSFQVRNSPASVQAAEEDRLFRLRRDTHIAQRGRLLERIGQTRREIDAMAAQLDAKTREIALIRKEQDLVGELSRRQLTTFTRPIAVERDLARFEGEHGALEAQMARAGGQINELELQVIAIEQARQVEIQKELRTTDARIVELDERRVAAEDQLGRVEMRAPTAGIVHELAVHGKGAVLRPGEIAMSIVPDVQVLVAELRIRPQDIDQVRSGQPARLRFTAFNQRTTPEVRGNIDRVAADLVRDPSTGQFYFPASVRMVQQEVDRLGDLKLQAGMPADAHILTGERTLASFLLKPISDQMQRAFREE
jgi:HlyD family secretion protein